MFTTIAGQEDRVRNAEAKRHATGSRPLRRQSKYARHFRHILLIAALFVFPAEAMAFDKDDGTLAEPTGKVLLRITGEISRTNVDGAAHFDRAMIEALPQTTLDTSTVVTDGVRHFRGVLMRDLLDAVGATGTVVTASALNDYVVDIPVSDFEDFDVLMAVRMDGERLTRRDKGPFWIVYPRDDFKVLQDIRYDSLWVWQLNRLDIR